MENMNTQRKRETEEAYAIVRDIQKENHWNKETFSGDKEGDFLSRAREEVVLPFFIGR